MKKVLCAVLAAVSLACGLCGCKERAGGSLSDSAAASARSGITELPAVVFLVRTDITDILSEDERNDPNFKNASLGFYDKDGNYYVSDDPELNAMHNADLAEEYAAGRLTDKLQYHKSCGAAFIEEQYAKLQKTDWQFELDVPEAVPAVQAEKVYWYGFYYDENGELQYRIIHENRCQTDIYADNDTVNEVYERITEADK